MLTDQIFQCLLVINNRQANEDYSLDGIPNGIVKIFKCCYWLNSAGHITIDGIDALKSFYSGQFVN